MFYQSVVENEVARLRIERAEQNATRNWRFRDLKSKESRILNSVLTNVIGLFLR